MCPNLLWSVNNVELEIDPSPRTEELTTPSEFRQKPPSKIQSNQTQTMFDVNANQINLR